MRSLAKLRLPSAAFLLLAVIQNVWAEDVSWITDADGNWNLETNWSSGSLPAAADNVTIDRPGDITVTVNERAVSILGLTSPDSLNISGQRFTVTGPASITGALELNGTTLTASGAAASFDATGEISAANSAFSATGGSIALPTLVESSITSGSRTWAASNGGQINVSSLEAATVSDAGRLTVNATTGGAIDLSSLTTLNSNDGTRNAFTIADPVSTIQLDALSSADNVTFTTTAGAVLDVPALTAYEVNASAVTWSSSGSEGSLNLPNLATVITSGSGGLSIQAMNSAQVDLRALATFDNASLGRSTLTVSGADSAMDLRALASANDMAFAADSSGSLTLPALLSFETLGRNTTWTANGTGSEIVFPALTNITASGTGRLAVTASAGAEIALNALTGFENTNASRNSFSATGAESQIKLDALASADDISLSALQGGVIRAPALESYASSISTTWDVTGTGSELSLANLATISSNATGRLTIQASGGAAVDLGELTAIQNPENGRLTLSSTGQTSVIDLFSLTSAQSLALTAATGSQLNLPALSDYTLEGNPIWQATGLGSELKFGSLTQLNASSTSRITVNATGGGTVDLSKLIAVANPEAVNRITFHSTGANSLINLSSLTSARSMGFTASAGGAYDLTKLASSPDSTFNVDGELTQLRLPALTAYETSARAVTWNVAGFGSELSFPTMTTLSASGSGRLTVSVASGSTLDLGALTTIDNPNNNTVGFTATGLATEVDLSSLTDARHVSFAAANGAAMDLSKLNAALNSSFGARGGSTLVVPALETYSTDAKAPIWDASGFGGRLAFPALTQISVTEVASFAVNALSGSEIDLSNVTTLDHSNTRQVSITASGADSVIKLNSLTTAPFVAFEANQRGGIELAALSSATDSSFGARSGSQLVLGAMANFEVETRAVNWGVSDLGSELSFPLLTSVSIPDRGSLAISAANGGKLNLEALTVLNNPLNRQVTISSVGPGSTIDASALASFQGTSIEARGGATIELSSDTTALQGAHLVMHSTGTINAGTIELQASSRVSGDGELHANLSNTAGVVAVGLSPGTLTVDGNFQQSAEAVMELEILGPLVDVEYDQLAIGGTASLAGKLLLTATNYQPELGTVFHIIDAPTGLDGQFSTVETVGLPPDVGFATMYQTDRMLLRASLKGDADLDGTVAFSDFLLLSSAFGGEGDWANGDFDGDGMTGFPDFLLLSSNFGRTEPAPAASVPEPSATLLLGLGNLLVLWMRGPRKRALPNL